MGLTRTLGHLRNEMIVFAYVQIKSVSMNKVRLHSGEAVFGIGRWQMRGITRDIWGRIDE
jgi:hypothetical protein